MVGLSVVLEVPKCGVSDNNAPQVINKTTIMLLHKPSTFLHQCFLCAKRLLPGKDVYMYKGDRGFCSVECRCKQIFMDEEESIRRDACSLAAMNAPTSPTSSSSSSTPPRQTPRNRNAGGFAY